MSDYLGSHTPDGFEDLVPWADPYIAALIDKLRRERQAEAASERNASYDRANPRGEISPPLPSENDTDDGWRDDWARRRNPRGR